MRSVLITGASSGIGRATALRVDALGWRVFAGVRREEDAESLRAAASERLTPLILDVTDREQVAAAARSVAGEVGEGGLHGLVNNAGITDLCPLEALGVDELRRMLEVNLVGQVAVTQALLPELRRASGHIVFISSTSGRKAVPLLGAYSISKYGLEAAADTFRQELRQWRIPVSVIEPGSIETPIWKRGERRMNTLLERSSAETARLYGKTIEAVGRLVERSSANRTPPEKVAAAIEHALTASRPRARYLVGRDARGQAIARRVLPSRSLDFAIARMLKV